MSHKFEQQIQIQSNDLNSLAASIREKLLGQHFQKEYSVYLIRCLWNHLFIKANKLTSKWTILRAGGAETLRRIESSLKW